MDFLLCKICQVTYDEEDHRPRHAPCGHELCSACVGALIKDSIFECPTCRQKNKVYQPDDLPIVFGLIDVIRAFKTMKMPSTVETKLGATGTTNDELCKVHQKPIGHRCLKCKMWLCEICLDSHSALIGCTTITSTKAVNSMKEKNTRHVSLLLTLFDEDAKYVSSKIQEHAEKRKEHLEKAEKHGEEEERLRKLLKQGSIHKNELVESKNSLQASSAPYTVMDGIELFTQRKQSLRIWSVKNLGTDSQIALLKASEEKTDVYVEMKIKDEKRHGKLSQFEENLYFHTFQKQVVDDDSICIPFARLENMNPSEASLVFMDISIGGIEKGRVLIRLDKDLPNIRDNFIHIVTGKHGASLVGVKLDKTTNEGMDILGTDDLPFSDIPVVPDSIGKYPLKTTNIAGVYGNGYLAAFMIYVVGSPIEYSMFLSGNEVCVIGSVEEGMDVITECLGITGSDMKIYDCGVVIENL